MTTNVEDKNRTERTPALFGIAFDFDRLDALAETIAAGPVPGQGERLVVTANVDHIVLLRRSAALGEAYRRSWRRTIDGMPVWLYARMRGVHVPERVTGADLLPQVITRLRPGADRIFFMVANEDIGERLVAWLLQRGFDRATVDFAVPPFGFELDDAYGSALSARIRAMGTTHLFLGVGCPRSETWADHHRYVLGDVYVLAVGAALAFFVGIEQRAPHVLRNTGFEWLWRVLHEPRRLAPRYFVRSWAFAAALAADLLDRKTKP